MASKAETQQLAGELLRLVPIGQALQSQDDTRMGEAYDEVYARLETKGVSVWETTEEMPDEITPYFIHLMAFNKMNLYGISDNLAVRIKIEVGDEGNKAIGTIKSLMAEPFSSAEQPTDY